MRISCGIQYEWYLYSQDEKGVSILRSEFTRALRDLSQNKAFGIYDVPEELLSSSEDPTVRKLNFYVSRMYEPCEVFWRLNKKEIIIQVQKRSGVQCE